MIQTQLISHVVMGIGTIVILAVLLRILGVVRYIPNTRVAIVGNAKADNFEDVRGFLQNGGQKGPQRKVLREGTYAINLAQFVC